MGLLSGRISCTRMDIVSAPEKIEFEKMPFRLLQRGTQLTQSEGFIPFEIEGDYEIGAGTYAFRVRIDTLAADPTLLKERIKELIKTETEQLGPPSYRRIRQLKDQAEEELRSQQSPKTRIIECVINQHVLYIGSTAKKHLGTVIALLRKIDVELEFKTPWIEQGEDQEPPAYIKILDPAQSILGCQFLKHLLAQQEVFLEGHRGYVKMVTPDGGDITLRGAVSQHYHRLIDEGAEVMCAKMIVDETAFQLDGFAYRISGFTASDTKTDEWTEALETRLDQLKVVWHFLDQKYQSWTK